MGNQMKHPAGNFCWFELGTTDQNGAKEFYGKLFGWQFRDNPMSPEMVYTTFTLDGKEVGACYKLGPEMAGVPTHWMPYVATDSADAMAAKVTELGGEVLMPAFDVMTFGRMVAFKDPTGAALSVWQPNEHQGVDLVGVPGAFCWGELATSDTANAKEFYTQLFGWQTKESTMPEMAYTEWINGAQPIGGMMPLQGPPGVPPHWLLYFAVADADATVAQAQALGGQVCLPPTDIPNTGRFAVLSDPQGGTFAVIKLSFPM
ncbi:MAG: VOC family protein [Acidobacteria bacterium]|nr:VOC family protein [Acidobacteriota bacterium]MBI3426456.1 VOC family protein [Acidobacteriota bacterium]